MAAAGVAWLAALNGLAGLGMLALAWWLNRTLPDAPLQMGQWAVLLSLLLMTSLIFEGGLGPAIQQQRDLNPNALAALGWLQIGLALMGTLTLTILATPLARLLAGEGDTEGTARLIRLVAPAVTLIGAGLIPKSLLQRDMRFREVACIEGGSTILMLPCAVALVPHLAVGGLVAAVLLRHLVETIAYWIALRRLPWTLLGRPSWSAAGEPVRYGLTLGAQSLVGTLARQGDVLLVGALAGTVAAGLYRQIQQIVVQPYAKLTLYVARAAFPAFARAQGDRERMSRGIARLQRLLALAVLPMLLGLLAVAPRLLAEYFGPQYAAQFDEATRAMRLLCVAAVATSLAYPLSVVLNAAGAARLVLSRQVIGTLAVVGFMTAGATWGLLGVCAGRAAAALLHGGLIVSAAGRVVSFGQADLLRSLRQAAPAALASMAVAAGTGAMLTTVWAASAPFVAASTASALRGALAIQVVAGALAYAVMLLALRVDPRAEWRALRG